MNLPAVPMNEQNQVECDQCHGKGEIKVLDEYDEHWADCGECQGYGLVTNERSSEPEDYID